MYTTQQKFLLSAHYTTTVFNETTLSVVVSNLVALVALIVSYPILLLTNNRMMTSVRHMLKKIAN